MSDFEKDRFDLDHEEGMVAYADGTVLSFTGNGVEVNMNVQGKTREGSTSTHNHPQGDSMLHTVFSGDDVLIFARYKEKEARMITTENGRKAVRRLIRTNNTSYADAYDFYFEVKRAQTTLLARQTRLKHQAFIGKISVPEYYYKLNESVTKYEKVFVDNAKKYNIIYRKEYL